MRRWEKEGMRGVEANATDAGHYTPRTRLAILPDRGHSGTFDLREIRWVRSALPKS